MLFDLRIRLRTVLAASALLASVACRHDAGKADGETKDLVADRNGRNIALIFGAANGLEGVATDLEELETMFKKKELDFGFEVHVYAEADAPTIIAESVKYAKEAGENGTLFWYFSGHGSEDGKIFTADQDMLGWTTIAEAIKKARSTPLRRLMVLEDSCFSGNIVDGTETILALAGQTSADRIRNAFSSHNSYAAPLYSQLLVLSASRKTETSADAGRQIGGGFTYSFRSVLEDLKKKSPDAKIRDFIEATQTETEGNFGHTPQFRADPEALVLGDSLFKREGGAIGGSPLSLALGADQGNDRFAAAIGTAAGVAKVGLCKGDLQACKQSGRIDLAFGAGAAKGDRLVFLAADALVLADGGAVTLLSFKADGTVQDAVAVMMKKS